MDFTRDYTPRQDDGFHKSSDVDSGANVLLSSILITLQRLEHHFEEQNSRISRSQSSGESEGGTTAPNSTHRHYDSLKRLPILYTQNPQEVGPRLPLTPPDSQAGSPADPYARVVSELKNRFAFVDSDDEGRLDEAPCLSPYDIQNSAQQRQTTEATWPPAILSEFDPDNAAQYDESVYSSQLLASRLAPGKADSTAEMATDVPAIAPANRKRFGQPIEDTHVATSHSVYCARCDTASMELRRGSSLGRSISVRKARLVAWTKARVSQDSDSSQAMSFRSINKAQSWVNWFTDGSVSRMKSLLKAPRRFYDKMTVTRVFYP